jgi:hypothetical protein
VRDFARWAAALGCRRPILEHLGLDVLPSMQDADDAAFVFDDAEEDEPLLEHRHAQPRA